MGRIRYVISLGSNCGNRGEAVGRALEWLSGMMGSFVCSEIYETPACGHTGNPYINAVAAGFTCLSLQEFDSELKEYEIRNGRDLAARAQGLVPIDLDIVISGEDVLRPVDFSRSFFQIGYRAITGSGILCRNQNE